MDQGFGYGLWDGVTGIFTQPVKGMQKEGLPGLWKGFARGVGGAAFKPAAGKNLLALFLTYSH